MKLTIDESPGLRDVEIIIRCAAVDDRLRRLIEQIRLYSFSIPGKREGKEYPIRLEEIFYFESVEERTFLYDRENVYECAYRLYELEERLAGTPFARINKSCILNTNELESVRALLNGRLEATLTNGERLMISRHYVPSVKQRLGMTKGSGM